MKSRVFIGSSASERSLAVLEIVADSLAEVGDCIKWTKAFAKNISNLDSLVRQTKMADFSILVAMADDKLFKKEEVYTVARDNVIFEFALFMGSTGLTRAFLLAEEGINLPTDLDGITLPRFTLDSEKYNSLEKRCEEIKETILQVSKGSELGFLPSTALAIGYYYNFVRKVCEEIHTTGKVVSGEKDKSTDILVKDFRFNVVIPENLDDNGVDGFKAIYYKKNGFNNGTTGSVATKRGYPFVFKLDPPNQNDSGKFISMYDVPSTLSTIVEALKLYMPNEQVGQSSETEHLERRELVNFAKVLAYLVSKQSTTKNNVTIIENAVL